MTINTQVRTAGPFAGNGVATTFPFQFKVFQASDLLVFRTVGTGAPVKLSLDSDYSVTMNTDQNANPGGSIKLLKGPLLVGSALDVTSNVSATQPMELTNQGGFFPKVIENSLDRLTILLQQLGFSGSDSGVYSLKQVLRFQELQGGGALPLLDTRRNKLLGFDASGNPVAAAPTSDSAQGVRVDLASPGGAELVAIQGPLDGEIPRNVYLNLIETVRVSRLGVEPGAPGAYNRTQLQKAIASRNRASLVFQGGDHAIDGLLTSPNGSIIYLDGDGAGVTNLVQQDLSSPLLRFDMGYAQGGGVRGVTLKTRVPDGQRGSSGVGLQVINANDNFVCRDFEIIGFDKAARIDGCYQPRFSNFRILHFADYGIFHSPNIGAGTDGAGASWRDGKVSNFGFQGDNTNSIGLLMQQASGEFFDTIDITTCNVGVKLQALSGSQVRYLMMSKVLGDSCNINWLIDGSAGAVVANEYASCWSSNAQDNGVVLQGQNIDTQKWIGGWIRDGRKHGVVLLGGKNIFFIGAEITRNSASAPNTYDGAYIAANVNQFNFHSCRIGNVSTTVGVGVQRYGINIETGSSTAYSIIGCDLNDNGTYPINNGATGTDYVISNNLPRRSLGTNRSSRTTMSISTSNPVTAGNTVYLGTNGSTPNVNASPFYQSQPGVVSELWFACDTAPGVNQAFVGTVMKNGAATSMSATISGASSFSTINVTDGFEVNPGDAIALRITATAGAAAANIRGYVARED